MARMNDWDAFERYKAQLRGYEDHANDRFSTRMPASLTEAFERSMMNSDTSFTYQHIQYKNTMPGRFIQVIGDSRVIRPLSCMQLRTNFLSSRERFNIAHMPMVPSTFEDDPSDPIVSRAFKTVTLSSFVAISMSTLDSRARHFTLYFADKFIDGAASFSPIFFESNGARVPDNAPAEEYLTWPRRTAKSEFLARFTS
ncbi:hypothetical protein [Enterobacter sp. CP102]|uniref:hypothetical protein n=1 Tax=Enterobacter sp. CP102 TaxID=2976431 RepID=UPI002204E40A|nr:hypothetical protein [Enterobacter sp. CP102]UWM66566.1 hypothetical protein N1249_23030 [Enterobacter sp. CP102]